MVLAAPGLLLTPPPSSSPPKTPTRSYSAQIRSQNEEKSRPPPNSAYPYRRELDIDHQTDPMPTCRVDEHQRQETPVMMSDSPHTSAPMVMQGRALVLKNTCRNASSTSVKKHLSWSPDIHPTARWVPSTPHRSRPAGYPSTRQPGAVGAKERECNVGHYVEADDEEETRPSAAVPPSVLGATTSTRAPTATIHDRGITTTSPAPSPASFACPVEAPPTTADARGVKTETMSPTPERSPRGAHADPCPATAASPFPSPRYDDGLRGKPDFLSEAHGPSTVALQQRCHRASAPARRPSWPPMSRPRPQRTPRPGESRISSPLRNRNFSDVANHRPNGMVACPGTE